MSSHDQKIGAWGEETAAVWLPSRGYEVIRRNVRTPYGEIDIVVQKNGVTVFVEVKILAYSKSFFPEQQITPRKREPMLNGALHLAAENSIDQWQIDVVAIEGKPGDTPVIHHFENIQ